MRVTFLGSGSGGFMCSAHLAMLGHSVRLFELPEFKANLEPIKDGKIQVVDIDGKPVGVAQLDLVTSDIGKALAGAEVVINPVPAFAYTTFAEACVPHVEESQTFITHGKGGGALMYANVFRKKGVKKRVYFGETNTLPFGCTKMGGNVIRNEAPTAAMISSAFPARDNDHIHRILSTLYATHEFRRGANIMETLLVDYNAITHTGPMICNAGRIESGKPGYYLFGKDSNTESVCRVIEQVDNERMALSRALGIKPYSMAEEIFFTKFTPKGKEGQHLSLFEGIHTEKLEVCEGPYSLKTRYLTEDVPYGLVTYSELGRMLGVPTPVVDAVITIASTLLNEDFRATGRRLETLGIDSSWGKDRLAEFLTNGW